MARLLNIDCADTYDMLMNSKSTGDYTSIAMPIQKHNLISLKLSGNFDLTLLMAPATQWDDRHRDTTGIYSLNACNKWTKASNRFLLLKSHCDPKMDTAAFLKVTQ